MATRRELYELVGRCAVAPGFLDKTIADPIAAASSVDIDLSDEQAKWISSKPQQFKNFVDMLQGRSGVLDCGTCIVDGH